jgi:hypothetical protein
MTDSTSESSPSPPPRCGRRSDEESSTAGSFRRLLHANSAANAMSKGDGRSSMTERKSGSRLSNRLASVFVSTRGSAVERTSHHRGSIAAGGARNSVEEGGGGTAPPHWAAQHVAEPVRDSTLDDDDDDGSFKTGDGEEGDTGTRDDRDRDSILDPGARDETRRRSVGFRVDDVDT